MPEAPSHDALEMMHVRERAQMFQERHMDTAELANFPKVVPLQVDDHHVLRGVFLARQEFPRKTFVFGRPSTAGPRALDRTGLDLPAADSEEPFGARRQQAVVTGLEERSKGRRGSRPEALVRGRGRYSHRKRDAMGEVDMEDFPVVDSPLRFLCARDT